MTVSGLLSVSPLSQFTDGSRPGFLMTQINCLESLILHATLWPMKCPYCGSKARRMTGKEIYPHRTKLWKRKFMACLPCEAWVGCHDTGGHKWKPFGQLANKALRSLRMRAHDSFDRLWKEGFLLRWRAYEWLSAEMGIDTKETHIGMFDEEQCRRVKQLSDAKYSALIKEGSL